MSPLLLLIGLVASPVQECSRDHAFSGPAPGESIALATATGRTEQVTAVPSPLTLDLRPDRPDGATPVLAYELVIRDASFSASGGMGTSGLLVPGDTVLAVPWALDPDCRAIRFPGDSWVPADAEIVVRVDYLRLHQGRRVIDVVGALNGYPYPTFVSSETQPPAEVAEWLSPRDFFLLLRSAPDVSADTPRDEQLRDFENFYRGGPTVLLKQWPGPAMLEWARRWASGGNAF